MTYNGVIFDEGGAVFNVKSTLFGAKGNGTTDDTAAIQSAITTAFNTKVGTHSQGGIVYLPPGTYKIATTKPLKLKRGVTLKGAGPQASILMTTSDTVHMVQVGTWKPSTTHTATKETTQATRGSIQDLGIIAQTADARTAGAGIYVVHANTFHITNVQLANQYNAIWVQAKTLSYTTTILNPCITALYIDRVSIATPSSADSFGIWINGNQETADIFINNVLYNGTTTVHGGQKGAAGIRLTGSGGVWISNSDILGSKYGMLVDPGKDEFQTPGTSQLVNYVFVTSCNFDTNSTHGIYFNPGSTSNGTIRICNFTGCWTSNAQSGSGVYIGGITV